MPLVNEKKRGLGKLSESKDLLLALLLSISLLAFFVGLQLIPSRVGNATQAFLRGVASFLLLCMPSFFYLRFSDRKEDAVLGHMPAKASLWRVVVFLLGAVCLGVLAGRGTLLLRGSRAFLFSTFHTYRTYSFESLGALLTYAFASAFLPFGVLYSRVRSAPTGIVVLSAAFLYTALGFSLFGAPLLFIMGCLLAMLRIQSDSFVAALVCNLGFLLGAYGDRVGFFGFLDALRPSWSVLAITGGLGVLLLLASLDYRFFKRSSRAKEAKRGGAFWLSFSLVLLLAVLTAVLLGGRQ